MTTYIHIAFGGNLVVDLLAGSTLVMIAFLLELRRRS